MIVSMHIMSESCDHYNELFVNKTVQEIKEYLYNNIEMYEPVSEYSVTFDDESTKEERYELDEMITEWYDYSWNREEENE